MATQCTSILLLNKILIIINNNSAANFKCWIMIMFYLIYSADIVRTSSRAGETIRDGPNRNCLSIDHVFSSSGNLVVYKEHLFIIACFVSLYCRRYMAEILPIRLKTLSNQSISLYCKYRIT